MIYELLGIGWENRIKGRDLIAMLGLSDERALYKRVEDERRNEDRPIATIGDGYFLPKDHDELIAAERYFTSKARRIFETAGTFRRRLKMTPGQLRFMYSQRDREQDAEC